MRVAITGSHGLIGTALLTSLRRDGHDVVRLVRGPVQAPDEVSWDPVAGTVDLAGLAGVGAVVNLSGAGVGDRRWTADYKRVLWNSRVDCTRTIARAVAALDPAPQVLVSASAIGFYGDRGEEELTEESAPGSGFLADLVQAWEGAADPARSAGVRVSHPRTGLVMTEHGGAFARLLPLARLGLAGPLGSGRQWWSWITLTDEIRALRFLIEQDVPGPVNLTAPAPQRTIDVVRAIARRLHRPALLPAPAFALRAVLGEFAGDVLASQRVLPHHLTSAGFRFEHEDLPAAVSWLVG